ncbi:MAG: thioesterase family protein [Rhodobacteraceae bacterium]|nr:thioesterase family protein [Paracoccaceae bacterium]
MTPFEGHDGPYAAPVTLANRKVPAEWIDYNGHMNVAYYVMAIDQALDRFLEDELGIGEAHAARVRQGPYALQSHVQYLGELLEGVLFSVAVRMIDCDAKRMHVFVELRAGGAVAATCEQLMMNVDLETRRSTPYPDWAQARMAVMLKAHAALERPAQLGAAIGIRRKV